MQRYYKQKISHLYIICIKIPVVIKDGLHTRTANQSQANRPISVRWILHSPPRHILKCCASPGSTGGDNETKHPNRRRCCKMRAICENDEGDVGHTQNGHLGWRLNKGNSSQYHLLRVAKGMHRPMNMLTPTPPSTTVKELSPRFWPQLKVYAQSGLGCLSFLSFSPRCRLHLIWSRSVCQFSTAIWACLIKTDLCGILLGKLK